MESIYETILVVLGFLSLVVIPVLTVLIKDLEVFIQIMIRVTDDGKITVEEFNEIFTQAGVILRVLVKIFYGRRLYGNK